MEYHFASLAELAEYLNTLAERASRDNGLYGNLQKYREGKVFAYRQAAEIVRSSVISDTSAKE